MKRGREKILGVITTNVLKYLVALIHCSVRLSFKTRAFWEELFPHLHLAGKDY